MFDIRSPAFSESRLSSGIVSDPEHDLFSQSMSNKTILQSRHPWKDRNVIQHVYLYTTIYIYRYIYTPSYRILQKVYRDLAARVGRNGRIFWKSRRVASGHLPDTFQAFLVPTRQSDGRGLEVPVEPGCQSGATGAAQNLRRCEPQFLRLKLGQSEKTNNYNRWRDSRIVMLWF